MKRRAGSVAVVLGLVAIAGCGSSSSSHSGSTPAVTVAQGGVLVPAHRFVQVPMTTNAAGTLTLQITFGVATDIVVAGIATPNCLGGVTQSSCTLLSYSETPSSSTPHKTLTAPGAAAGSYVVILGNVGAADETVSYVATLAAS